MRNVFQTCQRRARCRQATHVFDGGKVANLRLDDGALRERRDNDDKRRRNRHTHTHSATATTATADDDDFVSVHVTDIVTALDSALVYSGWLGLVA